MQPAELQRLLDGSPVHRALRLRADAADEVEVTLSAWTGSDHVGADGGTLLHGGVLATLLDAAATFALISASGCDWSTVDLRVDFLRPAPAGAVRLAGRVVHAGQRIGRAIAEARDPAAGVLLASAAGTFTRLGALPGTPPAVSGVGPAVPGGGSAVQGGESAVRGGGPAVPGGGPAVPDGGPAGQGGDPAVRGDGAAGAGEPRGGDR
jgi:uncharacterized protein (TIGR00369 family)